METRNNKGFTLIELLAVIAIVSFLTVVVLSNYRGSNDKLAISSAAQEVAINIRHAQAYGLSVKESNISSGVFDYAYGAYFTTIAGQNTSYVLFVDKNNNTMYDAGTGCGTGYANTECIERVSLRNGIRISAVEFCSGSGCPIITKNGVHVTFKRPVTDSTITFTSGSFPVMGSFSSAIIVLSSPGGIVHAVTVSRAGQISISNSFVAPSL